VTISLSLPSKTFLVGEYLVLKSGNAFVLNTEPRFSAELKTHGNGRIFGIHSSSPAGRFWQDNQKWFAQTDLTFKDQHEGLGGFGASSAQFASIYFLKKILQDQIDPALLDSAGAEVHMQDLLASYLQAAKIPGGSIPSGADVLAQVAGGLCFVTTKPATVHKVNWPFSDHGFVLLRTGHKVATHEHLKEIDPDRVSDLRADFDFARLALEDGNVYQFADAIVGYQEKLGELGFLYPKTRALLEVLHQSHLFLGVKACGALGADVVFGLYALKKRTEVLQFLAQQNLTVVATESDFSDGIKASVR